MKITIIKLGGAALKAALTDPDYFAALERLSSNPKVIVHGGGPAIADLEKKLGQKSEKLDGQRVTNSETLKTVEMALKGWVNTRIVEGLLKANPNSKAVGLCGLDAGLFQCQKKNPQLGEVGEVVSCNTAVLEALLEKQMTPVVSSIGCFKNNFSTCNINADLAASALAKELSPEKVIFTSDTFGIWDEKQKTIENLNLNQIGELKDKGIISGGMWVKTQAFEEFLRENPSSKLELIRGLNAEDLDNYRAGNASFTRVSR